MELKIYNIFLHLSMHLLVTKICCCSLNMTQEKEDRIGLILTSSKTDTCTPKGCLG